LAVCFGLLTPLGRLVTGFFAATAGRFVADVFFGGDFFLGITFVATNGFLDGTVTRLVFLRAGFSTLEGTFDMYLLYKH